MTSQTVSVDGQQVEGSPFSVSVSISPTQIRWRINDGTGWPCGVTVNSEGEVNVCEMEGDVKVNGQVRQLVNSPTFNYQII